MFLLIDTSKPLCRIVIVNNNRAHTYEWQADRTLARHLLGYIRDRLAEHGGDFHDLTGIGAMCGPGSFTGLRIGLAVANTLADSLNIPIIGSSGEDWREMATYRLAAGDNDRIIMPKYGSEAHVTLPKR